MPKRARSSSSSNVGSTTIITDLADFKPLFDDIFESSDRLLVDPFACLPFTKIRPISTSGVRRLISILEDDDADVDENDDDQLLANNSPHPPKLTDNPQTPNSQPHLQHGEPPALDSDFPLVVPLTGPLLHVVHDHFASLGYASVDAARHIAAHEVWYGIVDGLHCHEAVRYLKDRRPGWRGYLWPVICLPGSFSLQRYCQLARFRNHRFSPRFRIPMTFYDELNNLKLEYARLSVTKGTTPSQVQVARSYFGTGAVSQTMKMLTSLAVRLSDRVVTELGNIMTAEREDLAPQDADDHRMYRTFVRLNSLYASTAFMNAARTDAQINCLHRVATLCKNNRFRTVQHRDVSAQFALACDALHEEAKFLASIGSGGRKEWPTGMHTCRNNLIRTTMFDHELLANRGKNTVLKSLVEALGRMHPQLTVRKLPPRVQVKVKGKAEKTDEDNSPSSIGDGTATGGGGGTGTEDDENEKGIVDVDVDVDVDGEDVDVDEDRENRGVPISSACAQQHENNDNENGNVNNMRGSATATAAEDNDIDIDFDVNNNNHVSHINANVNGTTAMRRHHHLHHWTSRLKEKGIQCYNGAWLHFLKSASAPADASVDLILTEPPQTPASSSSSSSSSAASYAAARERSDDDKMADDDDDVDDFVDDVRLFPSSVRRLLKPGGYVVMIMKFRCFVVWSASFRDAGYEVMSHPYILVQDSETDHDSPDSEPQSQSRSQTRHFPTCGYQVALIAMYPGSTNNTRKSFTPDFQRKFRYTRCPAKRNVSAMLHPTKPELKLYQSNNRGGKVRLPVRPTEQSVDMLADLVDLFAPYGGSIVDPYAGTMTTALAALYTGRSCVCVERDEACFTLAVKRLIDAVPSPTTETEMDTEIRHRESS